MQRSEASKVGNRNYFLPYQPRLLPQADCASIHANLPAGQWKCLIFTRNIAARGRIRIAYHPFLTRNRKKWELSMKWLLAAMALSISVSIAVAHGALAESPVKIVAHRGASHDAPENTVAAFKLAWEQGADGAELDIALTKDKQLIVIHDDDTKRTCGINKVVAKSTLAELRALEAGSWKDPKFAGEKLPTLEEMLATVPEGKFVVIEIKGDAAAVPPLDRVLRASSLKPIQLVVISFEAHAVAEMKRVRPDLEAHWIVDLNENNSKTRSSKEVIAKAREIKADGLHLSAGDKLDAPYIAAVKAANLKLFAWTVNDAAMAKFLVAQGMSGITTDRPGWLREELAK